MAEEFYSFEKALRELHKTEEELKKLVSEGEIRAFRDDNSMKFKKEDIERFRKSGNDLPTHEAPTGELHEELFGEDSASGSDDVGMVTQQISDSSFLEEATDTPPPTMPGRGSKSGRKPAPRAGSGSNVGTASGSKSAARRRQEMAANDEGAGMRFVLVLASVVLLYAAFVALSARKGEVDGMTEGVSNMMAGMMKK